MKPGLLLSYSALLLTTLLTRLVLPALLLAALLTALLAALLTALVLLPTLILLVRIRHGKFPPAVGVTF